MFDEQLDGWIACVARSELLISTNTINGDHSSFISGFSMNFTQRFINGAKTAGLRAHHVKSSVYEKEMREMAICFEIYQNTLQQNKQGKNYKACFKSNENKAQKIKNQNFVTRFHSLMLKYVWEIQWKSLALKQKCE